MLSDNTHEQSCANKESLDTLFRYHLQENHLPSGYVVALGQCALIFIAAAGLLYAKPAADFAEHENIGIEKDAQINLNAISTCYSACIVLCAATIFFYRFHIKPQQIPAELASVIEPPFTAAEYFQKNVIIGIFSALSAVPFATIAYVVYQEVLPPEEFYPLLVYIFLANTLLHFLPVKLILDDSLYGAVPRYLKKLALQMVGWQQDSSAKQPLDADTQAQVDSLLNALSSHLAQVMNDLPAATDQLNTIKNYTLVQFVSSATFPVAVGAALTPQEELTARLIGVILVIGSCLGYLANPYLVFNEILGSSWLAALVTTLPTFFLAVLFTYFGDTMGKQRWADLKAVAHYLSQCLARDPANPAIFLQATVFRLYPAATFVCMTINVFMAIFSAAAAMEMMRFAFENSVSPGAMLALYVLAQIGISIIGISAPLDYQKMLLTYYALYLDQGPRHDIMMFHEGVEALQSDLFRLKPAPDVHPAEAAEENAESKSASITTWCSSWHGGSQEDSSASQRLLEACV